VLAHVAGGAPLSTSTYHIYTYIYIPGIIPAESRENVASCAQLATTTTTTTTTTTRYQLVVHYEYA